MRQRLYDLVPARAAAVDPVDGLAPPLQADLADQRLATPPRALGELGVEGVEREQVFAPFRRREQRSQVPVVVVPADSSAADRREFEPFTATRGAAADSTAPLHKASAAT